MGILTAALVAVPGDADAVLALAGQLRERARESAGAGTDIYQAVRAAPTWQGQSQWAFADAADLAIRDVNELTDGLESGAQALESFGWEIRAAKNRVADLRLSAEKAEASYWEHGLQLRAGLVAQMFQSANLLRNASAEIVETLAQRGRECAAVLCQALHTEPVVMRKNKNVAELRPLDDRLIKQALAELDHIDYRRMKQQNIGDCYFLAAVMAVASTEDGQRLLRDSVRPRYDADGRVTGFYVRLFTNPLAPNPEGSREVYVESVYTHGASADSSALFAILESAYGQSDPYGVASTLLGGIEEGTTGQGLEIITGHGGTSLRGHNGIVDWGPAYDPAERAQIIQALQSGQPVVTETYSGNWLEYDEGKAVAQAQFAHGGEKVEIAQKHVYMVEAADEKGITLRNPWGYNIHPSTQTKTAASFTLTWEEYSRLFASTQIGTMRP
ncbi:hypothetical protein [Buchananella hordeovulneris]|uniref:hypothetical protein n=1 Tax=Buchananella hordeovulneris TaxID=52770 RepID=UPI000F997BF2|nr:hypothetical protein [Buchananella hordeovulneris]RRD44402.1 hypothetical protein EII13_04710 [Buchananella hordeovulneris]